MALLQLLKKNLCCQERKNNDRDRGISKGQFLVLLSPPFPPQCIAKGTREVLHNTLIPHR